MFYVKNENGELVEATLEDFQNGVQLYDKDGNKLVQKQRTSDEKNDGVKQLSEAIQAMAEQIEGINTLKEKQEAMAHEIEKYREHASKAFPFAGVEGEQEKDFSWDDHDAAVKALGFDPNVQGFSKNFQADIYRSSFRGREKFTSEETRKEMARYFSFWIKGFVMDDPFVKRTARNVYSKQIERFKGTTDLGDTGNTFPVPDIVESEIINFARESSVVLQDARIWPMASEIISIPVEREGISANWGNTTQEGTPQVDEVEMTAKELSVFASARNMTVADSRSDIVAWIAELMAEACGLEIDDESFNGDGTDVCSGLFSTASNSVTLASPNFAGLTYPKIAEMKKKLYGRRKEGAKFYAHDEFIYNIEILTDDQNRPLIIDNPIQGQPMKLQGYPLRPCVKCNSTDGASANCMIFGSMRYMGVGRRLNSMALMVDPYGLWTTNRTRWKIYQRWALRPLLAAAFVKMITAAG